MNLIITGLFGLTILIGVILVLIFKNNKKITELSISIGFSVLIYLIVLELIPESLEYLSIFKVILYALIGIFVLKILDLFIPEHEHSNSKNHSLHIVIVSSIALILHNIIEGMALYTALSTDFHIGLMIGLGVGLHNIPMGMVVSSSLEESKYSKTKILIVGLLVSLSTLLGGFIMSLTKSTTNIIGIMNSLTLGMIIYISLFELLEHMLKQNKKSNIIGFIIGTLLFIISLMFHSH